ncbi:hypothetical protein RND71_044002 [Anisodus tanguticus]|uniref:Uncharacterized protein n=1 Tax=Anisodus tanguticus TaxID=243964 RepID=A0AAE1QNU5_9SOLA|nr:hypothetical protein RND71_044002 [Anisodus tanguticus]
MKPTKKFLDPAPGHKTGSKTILIKPTGTDTTSLLKHNLTSHKSKNSLPSYSNSAFKSSKSLNSKSQRLIQRERERHQRGLQFQDNNVSQVGNPNLTLFSEPIKHEHEDATTKRIKNALGEFTQMKDYIVKNQKQLVGISTSLFRAKDNKANKAKIEQIFSEMKNNIQPLTGLEDNEFPPNLNYSNSVQTFQENEYQNSNNLNVNNFGPEKIIEQCKEQSRIKDIKNVNNNLSKSSNQNKNYQHSDQEDISLDEVSDENESQINGKTPILNNKRNLNSMQENDTQSNKNDSYSDNRKKKKIEDNFLCNDNLKPIVNSVNNDTTNPNSDKLVSKNTVFKKTESKVNNSKVEKELIEKEDDDNSSVSSDDSDISSSSSNSSSSDEEENHSESGSVSSTAIKDSPNNINNAININNELNLKNSKEEQAVNINSSTQAPPPQRSWNLSYIYNKLSNNENVSTNNQKSPPVTKAFLKQSLSKDKVENVIDSVVKGSETNEHLFNSESNSSLSSSSSSKLKFDAPKIKKSSTDVSVSKTKRQKTSQSPRSKENKVSIKQNDETNSPKIQKSTKKEPKLEKKTEKTENLEKSSKFSASSKNQLKEKDLTESLGSPINIKKETKNSSKSKTNQNNKSLPEIPKNLLVSIDLSLLDKKEKKESKSHQTKSSNQFKKEVESTKKIKESESSQNTKDVTIKKESDFKDKYRSIEKVSSKSDKKSKNNKSSVKSDKSEKYESEQEKSDKKCKNEENEEIKESSKKKSKEKSKSSSKKVSFEFKEEVKKDKSSKHKKSKKEFKKVESSKEEEIKINSTKELSNSEVQNSDKNKDKSGTSKVHKENKHNSKDSSVDDPANKQDQEINLLMEGKRLKHLGDREKDLVKQYCKYLEAALYFLQSARCYENKNVDQPDKSFRTYQNTLNFMKSTLQNKFLKSKSQHSEENKLNTLGLSLVNYGNKPSIL